MTSIILVIVITVIISYIIGSIPTAYLVGRAIKKVDIRKIGSHNMGAMNTFYTVGFWPGMLVLIADIGKGMLALLVAFILAKYIIAIDTAWIIPVEMIAGAVVILGHNFTMFLNFKGGKGGATAIGVLIFIIAWINIVTIAGVQLPIPLGCVIYLALFLIIMLITRWPTFAYGVSFLAFPLIAWFAMNDLGLTIYSIVIILVPILMYIPRIKQILGSSGGDFGRAIFRKNLKDRM